MGPSTSPTGFNCGGGPIGAHSMSSAWVRLRLSFIHVFMKRLTLVVVTRSGFHPGVHFRASPSQYVFLLGGHG